MIFIFTDGFSDQRALLQSLSHFRQASHEVVLFHILDPAEMEMPFSDISTLEDMETEEYLPYSPEHSRSKYLKLLAGHIEGLRKECRGIHIDYELLNTEKALDQGLHRYLSVREKRY